MGATDGMSTEVATVLGSAGVRTTCPYCGVGCGVDARQQGNGQVLVRGDASHPANRGRLCSKGAALGETLDRAGRLLVPEVQGRRVAWHEALDFVARGLADTIANHTAEAVGFYVSGQLLTEDYYAANKLMKGYIGTANIDTNSRLCMSSSVAGHVRAFGTDTVPGCYEDLELADLIVMVGSNAAWCHPVLWQRVLAAQRARPDMRLVVIDPRATATSADADLHLPLRPGSDVLLFNGLLAYLAWRGAIDASFIARHTEGFDSALSDALTDAPEIPAVSRGTGLEEADIERFYGLFAAHARTVTCYSQGVNQSSAGTDKVNAILNCHLATGRIGRPGMGPFSLTGQPNAMGGREVGGLANQLAAHLRLEDPLHRATVQSFWDSPRIAEQPGLKAVDLFRAAADGRIRALWIMATNPVVSLPEADVVRAALARCPLVIVSDCVAVNDTLPWAHVRLPAHAWLEKDGTVTNSERCISRQRPLLPPAGEARADWWMVAEVAKRLGHGAAFDWRGPADIFREHARLSAYRNVDATARDFDIGALADIDDRAYAALMPVQWPVPAGSSVGQARLFGDGRFFRTGGRAALVPVRQRAPASTVDAAHPFVLNTGRMRDHWHTLTRTGLSARLSRHRPEPTVEMHPADAAPLGLHAGMLAEVASVHGRALARVVLDAGQQRGSIFMPMHWSASNSSHGRVAAVVNAHTDPHSGQPELKHTPVHVRPAGMLWHGLLLLGPGAGVLSPICAFHVRVNGGTHQCFILAGTTWPMEDAGADLLAAFTGVVSPAAAATVRFEDRARRQARVLVTVDDHPWALLLVQSAAAGPVAGEWLADAFDPGQRVDAARRRALIAGRPPRGEVATGALVCACHGVCELTLGRAIAAGSTTVNALGEHTGAGTGCGSCRPELQRLIAAATASRPATPPLVSQGG